MWRSRPSGVGNKQRRSPIATSGFVGLESLRVAGGAPHMWAVAAAAGAPGNEINRKNASRHHEKHFVHNVELNIIINRHPVSGIRRRYLYQRRISSCLPRPSG